MPYIIFAIGALALIYGLYKFFMSANWSQIKALIGSLIVIVLSGALFFMAVTGRLAAALGLFVALLPFAASYWRRLKGKDPNDPQKTYQPVDEAMTADKAREILGIDKNATEDDIRSAWKHHMAKLHPDKTGGNEWFARQLNAARDLLLKKHKND